MLTGQEMAWTQKRGARNWEKTYLEDEAVLHKCDAQLAPQIFIEHLSYAGPFPKSRDRAVNKLVDFLLWTYLKWRLLVYAPDQNPVTCLSYLNIKNDENTLNFYYVMRFPLG